MHFIDDNYTQFFIAALVMQQSYVGNENNNKHYNTGLRSTKKTLDLILYIIYYSLLIFL